MIAGRLNEILQIYAPVVNVNEYGERVETFEKTYTTRARVDHNSGNRSNTNDEIVFNYQKTFNVRSYVPLQDTYQIEWQGKRYRILATEKRREYNDILINAELINE